MLPWSRALRRSAPAPASATALRLAECLRMLRGQWARQSAAALPLTPSTVFRAGSKDAGGSDWLQRARPPGFFASAAAITELPVVSARIAGARSPRLLVSLGWVLPGGGVGLGRVHPIRSCSRAAASRCRPPPSPPVSCTAVFVLAPLPPRLLFTPCPGGSLLLCLCRSFHRVAQRSGRGFRSCGRCWEGRRRRCGSCRDGLSFRFPA